MALWHHNVENLVFNPLPHCNQDTATSKGSVPFKDSSTAGETGFLGRGFLLLFNGDQNNHALWTNESKDFASCGFALISVASGNHIRMECIWYLRVACESEQIGKQVSVIWCEPNCRKYLMKLSYDQFRNA